MPAPSAETAYLFRHALLRDAAYELQLPAERAMLHELAFYLIEEAFGGRAPEPPSLAGNEQQKFAPHATDVVAIELAWHAGFAQAADARLADLQCHYLHRGAEYAESTYRNATAISAWESLAHVLAGSARGEAWRRAGNVASDAGDSQRAERAYTHSLAAYRESKDRRREGITIGSLAGVHVQLSRFELGEKEFEQALGIHREAGNQRALGIDLGNLATLYHRRGRSDEAGQAYREALAIHRDVGNRRFEAIVLANLAIVLQEEGHLAEAEHAAHQALVIHRTLGDRRYEGMALANRAVADHHAGRMEEAEQGYEQAIAIHREVGNRRSEGIDLGNLALILQQTGRLKQSEECYALALVRNREAGNRRFEGIALANLANLYHESGRLQQARRAYELAIGIHRALHDQCLIDAHLREYALFTLATGEPSLARELWREGAAMSAARGELAEQESSTRAMREACAKAGVPPFDEVAR